MPSPSSITPGIVTFYVISDKPPNIIISIMEYVDGMNLRQLLQSLLA